MSSGDPDRLVPDRPLKPDYDLVVVGGGINGAGIARDAALRGLSVLLLEKGDFGSGTSSWSSRLIHGGLRYLEYGEIPLVHESLRERRLLLQLAPHLVRPLQLCIPIYRGGRRSRFVIRLGMLAYDLLSIGRRVPRHAMLSRDELLDVAPGLESAGLVGGARYFDAQLTFVERLVIENVVGAREAGADVRNHSPVIGINLRRKVVESVQFTDNMTGDEVEVGARVVINAAGPWVDRVLSTVNRETARVMGGTKGSHIVTAAFEGAPDSAFYVEAEQDGRPFFIIPWNGQYLIGTTDTRYRGDPGDARPDDDEIDYLLHEVNRVFPAAAVGRADIHYAYAGVRPLPRQTAGPESAITRKHIILRHRKLARGLISIIGGKITTYRNLAEQAVNAAVRVVGGGYGSCTTRSAPLPGGLPLEPSAGDWPEACRERLSSIYGSRAAAIAGLATNAALAGYVDEQGRIPRAEIAYAVQNEFATTLVDIVHRRTMVGLDPDQGRSVTQAIARAAAEDLGWDAGETRRQLAGLEEYNAALRVDN